MTTPTDYANLTGWWDASQETFANNDPVGTFTDRSGNARDLTQATAGLKPLFHTNIFPLGGPAIDFDGTDDQVNGAAISNFITASAYSFFAVVLVDTVSESSASTWLNNAVWRDASAYAGLMLHATGPKFQLYNYDGTDDHAETTISTGTAYVVHARHESGNIYISINGGSETSTASGDTQVVTGALWVGGAFRFLDGKIGELFFYNVARSTTEIAALNAYLVNKWLVDFRHPVVAANPPAALDRTPWLQRSYPNQFTAATSFDPTLGGGLSSNYKWQSWLDPNRADWQQRDRINANLTGTAANPLPSPLDAAAQQAQHNVWYSDRRNYPQQRAYISNPSLLSTALLEGPPLIGVPPAYRWQSWLDPNRADWQQRTYYDRSLLSTALLEGALLGRADNERHAWFRRDPYWTPPGAPGHDPNLLTTALLEGPLLGIHPRDLWRRDWDYYRWLPRDLRNANTVITIPLPSPLDVYQQAVLHALFFTDRRQYPQQRIYIDPNQFPASPTADRTLAGCLAQSYWAWRRTPYWTPPGAPGHDPNLFAFVRWLMHRRRGIRGTARPLRSRHPSSPQASPFYLMDQTGAIIYDQNGNPIAVIL